MSEQKYIPGMMQYKKLDDDKSLGIISCCMVLFVILTTFGAMGLISYYQKDLDSLLELLLFELIAAAIFLTLAISGALASKKNKILVPITKEEFELSQKSSNLSREERLENIEKSLNELKSRSKK